VLFFGVNQNDLRQVTVQIRQILNGDERSDDGN
jgi:hypothetical protein